MTPTFRLEAWLWLPLARPEVFDFFANPANLQRITPPFLAFRMLTSAPIEMRAGTLIDYRIGLRGVPLTWRSEITAWNPPAGFVDAQIRGPYRWWEHTHTFEEKDEGTLVVDVVRYGLRGPAVLHGAMHRLIVAPDLTRIFTYRHEALQEALDVRGRAQAGAVVISRETGL